MGATAELSSDKKKKLVQVYKQKPLQRGKNSSFIKTGHFLNLKKKNSVIVGRCFRNILQPIKTN